MPRVNRNLQMIQVAWTTFQSHKTLLDKLCLVGTFLAVVLFELVPRTLLRTCTPIEGNVGRLRPVIPHQVYQQAFYGGNTNCTVLLNQKRNKILLHIATKCTREFKQDIRNLNASVEFIIIPNWGHDSFAEELKLAYPDAKLLTCKRHVVEIQKVVPVDGTIDEHMDVLERDFGLTRVFCYDNHCPHGGERNYQVQLFSHDDTTTTSTSSSITTPFQNKNLLLVGQCGYANLKFSPRNYLLGFCGWNTGRYFRLFYYAFTKDHDQVGPFWQDMVTSVPHLEAAVFTHGEPVVGPDTRQCLLQFYTF